MRCCDGVCTKHTDFVHALSYVVRTLYTGYFTLKKERQRNKKKKTVVNIAHTGASGGKKG